MKIKTIVEEDLSNYKLPSMLIGFPNCSFKCDNENGTKLCQNWSLTLQPNIDISYEDIRQRYMSNPFMKAFVFGGLEPFDSYMDMFGLINHIRKYTQDNIVIYTGYDEDEIGGFIKEIKEYQNIIIKYGRFKPNQDKHYDELLGVELASDNQYAIRIS